ncbi:MAG: Rpn family recombination-promoting nuclease/putative transposase [Saprospiraceae bacterium]|nr:Rpn family recombination-promoting nuclease/putative transposase [Saprospiraceae bacterium]
MTNRRKTRNRDHDIFIKGILSINELVLLLLHRYIPLDLQPYIDFSTLQALSDAHIDNKLVAQYSDSIHECALVKERLPKSIQDLSDLPNFRFCFLWEHKSSKPTDPIEGQVERYRYAIISSDLKNKRKPSIILPIILYHGKTKWTKKMVFEDYETHLPSEILKYLPAPRYIFIDIADMSKQEIEQMIDLKILRSAFIALKFAHDEKFFQDNLAEILKFVETSSSEIVFQSFFKMLLEYVQRRSQMEADAFNKIVQQKLEPNMVTNIKTIFEIAEEKAELRGIEKGIEEGRQETARIAIINMLKLKTFSNSQIADILEVDIDFVKKVQDELASNPLLKG